MTEKIKEVIDKYPWLLMVVPICIAAFIGYFFLTGKNSPQPSTITIPINSPHTSSSSVANSQTTSSNTSGSSASAFNLFVFLSRLFGFGNSHSGSQSASNTSLSSATSQSSTEGSAIQSVTTTNSTNTTSSTTGNSQQNTNQTQSSQNADSSSGSGSDDTPIQIIFESPDGGTQVYTPPATPPVDVTWGRYVNTNDRYAIDYPINWQVVKTDYNGHEGVSLYAPGTDPTNPNAQYIGFGLASYYLLPAGQSQQNSYSYPVTIESIAGTMYTQGELGTGSMALVAQTAQGYFGMGSNISSPSFIYIYNYMLQSLTFGPQ